MKKKNHLIRKIFDFHKLNVKDLAKAAGTTPRYIYLIKYGRPCGAHLALKIEKVTAGVLNRHLLRPDIFGEK